MADFFVHEFSSVCLHIFFLVLFVSICYSFCSILQEKKILFQFYRLLKSVFLFGITRKKKLFQFYRLLKSVFLFGITRKKKLFQFYRLLKSLFMFGITRGKKIVIVFFFPTVLYLLQLYKFLFLFLDNRQQQDCSFSSFCCIQTF